MAKRRSHKTEWLLLLGLIAITLIRRSSSSAASSPATSPATRSTTNPRTGRPIVTPGTRKLSAEELRALIALHGFKDAEKAFAIAMRESGGFADVVVDTRGMHPDELRAYWGKPAAEELSIGLWQINTLASPSFDVEALKTPDGNALAALQLSKGGTSWGPWGG